MKSEADASCKGTSLDPIIRVQRLITNLQAYRVELLRKVAQKEDEVRAILLSRVRDGAPTSVVERSKSPAHPHTFSPLRCTTPLQQPQHDSSSSFFQSNMMFTNEHRELFMADGQLPSPIPHDLDPGCSEDDEEMDGDFGEVGDAHAWMKMDGALQRSKHVRFSSQSPQVAVFSVERSAGEEEKCCVDEVMRSIAEVRHTLQKPQQSALRMKEGSTDKKHQDEDDEDDECEETLLCADPIYLRRAVPSLQRRRQRSPTHVGHPAHNLSRYADEEDDEDGGGGAARLLTPRSLSEDARSDISSTTPSLPDAATSECDVEVSRTKTYASAQLPRQRRTARRRPHTQSVRSVVPSSTVRGLGFAVELACGPTVFFD